MEDAKIIITGDMPLDTTDLQDAIQTRFNTYKTDIQLDYPPNYSAAEPGITALVIDILALVAAETGIPYSDVLETLKQKLIDYETANDKIYPCPKCQATSFLTVNGRHVNCDLSDGYTQTEVQYVIDPSSVTYIAVP